MRRLVVVSDRLAHAGGSVRAGRASRPPEVARVAMDALVAQQRGVGWRVVDRRCDAASVV